MRILGVIGIESPGWLGALDRVMEDWGYVRVEGSLLAEDYPFERYELCEFIAIPLKGFAKGLVTEYNNWVLQWAVKLSQIVDGPVMGLRADGIRPPVLKVYREGRIVLKSGPDDDDETGLIARESEPQEIADFFQSLGVNMPVKEIEPWRILDNLGFPPVKRARECMGQEVLSYLKNDSPLLEWQ